MDAASILQFLGCLKAKNTQHRGKWVQASCPLAPWNHDTGKDKSPSFAIRVEPNKESFFNCFVCNHGKLSDLVAELQFRQAQNLGYDLLGAWNILALEDALKSNIQVKEWGAKVEDQPEYPIPEWWLHGFKEAWEIPMAREYLEKRQVSHEISKELDIRWDRSMRTVCFPVRNGDGELVSMRGRRVEVIEGQPPYHVYPYMDHTNGQAWLGEHVVDYGKTVLMVESVFDLASVLRVYKNVVAPMSVGINEARIKRMSKCSDVITLFDQGVGGSKARGIVSKYLKTSLIHHLIPDAKDPGEMTELQLREQLGAYLKLI